jgi:hypothetical protein
VKRIVAVILFFLMCTSLSAEPKKRRVADKKFWFMVGALTAAAFADGYSSHRCIVANTCNERNPLFGKAPSYPRIILEGGGIVAAESLSLYYLKKRNRDNKAWGWQNLWWMTAAGAIAGHTVATSKNMQLPTELRRVPSLLPSQADADHEPIDWGRRQIPR